jgi:hypothetical protein
MRKESNNGKSAAVKLPQPGNVPGAAAQWPASMGLGLARVERWLEPADHIDYLVRRFILRRVNRGMTTRARSVRASVGAEFDARCAPAART